MDCDEHKAGTEKLDSEVVALCDKCSPSEAQDLSSKHDAIKAAYERVCRLVRCRIELCQQWTKFAAMAKDAKDKLDAVADKLAASELSQAELDAAAQDLVDVRKRLSECDENRHHIVQLMTDAEMTIKERGSQKVLHLQIEIVEIITRCDRFAVMLKEKQGQLDELSTLWSQFEEKRRQLSGVIENTEQQVEGVKVKDSSLQGIKDMSEEIKALGKDFDSHNPELKDFRELGQQLMAADPSNKSVAQEVLGSFRHNKYKVSICACRKELLESSEETFSGCRGILQVTLTTSGVVFRI